MASHLQHKEIVDCMLQSTFYPHAVEAIELRQTHISSVFLTGPFVYKIKKPVNLGFLDFSTLTKRRHYCDLEVRLNRRLAKDVYLQVIPITANNNGTYALNGAGRAVEYAVQMRQLRDQDAMARCLKRGALTDSDMERLNRRLVEFYDQAPIIHENVPNSRFPIGTQPAKENFEVLQSFAGEAIDKDTFEAVRTAALDFIHRRRRLFERRAFENKIRDGHGDLRTDHIYFTHDDIQIIDCIEFNDNLRRQDIISDLAFLALDLEDHEALPFAHALIREYLEYSNDFNSIPLFDFYRCYRAMVRCKVNCLRMRQVDQYTLEYKMLIAGAEKYLSLARAYATACSRPMLWILCGLPASGKSTIAAELAEIFDLKLLRSDVIRKSLFSEDQNGSRTMPFAQGIYTAEATAATYDRMLSMAAEYLQTDFGVVLDATFSSEDWRLAARQVAQRAQSTAVFVECQAPQTVLAARLKQRETAPTLSDARLEHMEELRAHYEPFNGSEAGHLAINTDQPLQVCLRAILMNYLLSVADRQGGNNV